MNRTPAQSKTKQAAPKIKSGGTAGKYGPAKPKRRKG